MHCSLELKKKNYSNWYNLLLFLFILSLTPVSFTLSSFTLSHSLKLKSQVSQANSLNSGLSSSLYLQPSTIRLIWSFHLLKLSQAYSLKLSPLFQRHPKPSISSNPPPINSLNLSPTNRLKPLISSNPCHHPPQTHTADQSACSWLCLLSDILLVYDWWFFILFMIGDFVWFGLRKKIGDLRFFFFSPLWTTGGGGGGGGGCGWW